MLNQIKSIKFEYAQLCKLRNKCILRQTLYLSANMIKVVSIFLFISLTSCSANISQEQKHSVSHLADLASTNWLNQSQQFLPEGEDLEWGMQLPTQAQELLHLAEKNNPKLSITALRVKQAITDYEIASGSLWPEINLQTSKRVNQSLSSSSDLTKSTNQLATLGVGVNWELDLWQKLASTEKQKTWTAKAQQFALVAARQSLQSQVLITYLEVIEQNNLLKLNRNHIENQKRRLNMSITRLDNGLSTGIDIRNAKTNLYRLLESQKRINYKREQAKRRLNLLLGNYSEQKLDLQLTLPELQQGINLLAPKDILLNRPDVRAAEATLIAAGYSWDVAKKKMLPKLTLNFNYDARRADASELFDINYWLGSLTASLVQPVFYQGVLSKQAEKAYLQQQIQFEQYKATLLDAWQQVEAAIQNESLLSRRQELLEKAFHEAKEAERQTEDQYNVGVTNSFELLSAQRTRTAVEVDLMVLSTARLKNRIQLILALGVPQSLTKSI